MHFSSTLARAVIAGTLLLSTASGLEAQSRDALLLRAPEAAGRFGRVSPGITTSTPVAFGPGTGDVFLAVGYQQQTRYGGEDDAAVTAGFGLFRPDIVGLEIAVTSLSTMRSGLGDRVVASAKLHHAFQGGAAVAVGVEGIGVTGDHPFKRAFYATASKMLSLRSEGSGSQPFSSATVTAGIGNRRFCAEDAPECSANLFASAALRATTWSTMIADWNGQDLNFGVSITPIPQLPLVFTPAIADLAGRAGDKPRFVLGMGTSFRF
jgi:hypothetical protein